MKKKEKIETEYWRKLVNVYFDFCREKFGREPSFDGSAPRDLKMILSYLKKITEEDDESIWSEMIAIGRFKLFLEACYIDKWLSKNFLLQNLNRQKDKIIFLKNNVINDDTGNTKTEQLRKDVNSEFNRRYPR